MPGYVHEGLRQTRALSDGISLRRYDGEYRWLLDSGVPRFNADQSFAGYIGSAFDVTERKAAEETLSTVSSRLIEAHEEERAWLARELHDDICQRLCLLRMNLGRLKDRDKTSALEFREGFKTAIELAADLAIDMQALSHRLHSSKLEYSGTGGRRRRLLPRTFQPARS